MQGALKGERERAIILAHQVASFTGKLQSKGGLRPLGHYLKEASQKPKTARESGRQVAAMLKGIAARKKE